MLMELMNTKAAANLATSLGESFKDAPTSSGSGVFDSRGFLDGSGWTVATGSAKATGATQERSADPMGATTQAQAAPMQAGSSPLMQWALLGLGVMFIIKKMGA